jgi:hypothetical protein
VSAPEPQGPPTHRIVVDEPGLFTLYEDDRPGRYVFHMDNGGEQIEVVTTLDALVVIAYNVLALVASERPPAEQLAVLATAGSPGARGSGRSPGAWSPG